MCMHLTAPNAAILNENIDEFKKNFLYAIFYHWLRLIYKRLFRFAFLHIVRTYTLQA